MNLSDPQTETQPTRTVSWAPPPPPNRKRQGCCAAILLLPLVKKGITAKVIDDHNEIMIVDKEIHIEGEIGDIISIIPLTEKVEGITLKGLEYPLHDATISMGESIGISNRLINNKATIAINKGKLLLIKARD